jgi:hypothetical protein
MRNCCVVALSAGTGAVGAGTAALQSTAAAVAIGAAGLGFGVSATGGGTKAGAGLAAGAGAGVANNGCSGAISCPIATTCFQARLSLPRTCACMASAACSNAASSLFS